MGQLVNPPFEGIKAEQGREFRMVFNISNANELRGDSVVPKQAVFERSNGSEWSIRCDWSGNKFRIDAPTSSMTFTDDLKLVRIIGESAHGNREIWP